MLNWVQAPNSQRQSAVHSGPMHTVPRPSLPVGLKQGGVASPIRPEVTAAPTGSPRRLPIPGGAAGELAPGAPIRRANPEIAVNRGHETTVACKCDVTDRRPAHYRLRMQ
jgi:hypothetical protein